MTLLVTGGAGYIGSVVVERALARGHRIVVIDNLQEGHAAAVPPECRLYTAVGCSSAHACRHRSPAVQSGLHDARPRVVDVNVVS